MISKNRAPNELRKNKVLFLMILPSVLFFFILCYVPLTGLLLAFKNYNIREGVFLSPWAGLNNFKFLFISGKAMLLIRNTLLYNAVFIVSSNVLEIMFAIMLNYMAGKFFKKICQSLMLFPYFISWVVASAIVYNLLSYEYGAVNVFLSGMGAERMDIYGTPVLWKYIIPFFYNWKWVGYGTIMYLAVITGIDPEYLEAAECDGANLYQKIRHIVIPQMVPLLMIMILLSVGRILRGDFDMFYQLVGSAGNLFDATDVIDTYVFRALTNTSDFGRVAAATLFQSVMCFIMILSTNTIVKRYNKDYSLF